jgi:hypothetical protein
MKNYLTQSNGGIARLDFFLAQRRSDRGDLLYILYWL